MFKNENEFLYNLKTVKFKMQNQFDDWKEKACSTEQGTVFWRENGVTRKKNVIIINQLFSVMENKIEKLANKYGFSVVGNFFRATCEPKELTKYIKKGCYLAKYMNTLVVHMLNKMVDNI